MDPHEPQTIDQAGSDDASCSSTGNARLPSITNDWIGTLVDERYKLLSLLGSGGFSNVYSATDILFDRKVALKLFFQNANCTIRAYRRFSDEIKNVSRLNHPNIIKVHAAGSYRMRPYMVMDYVDGKTLRQLILEEPFSCKRVVTIAAQICEALTHAHANSVLHRDIKPSNICIINHESGEEQVKLLDFGQSKLQEDFLRETQSDSMSGTPLYMSPERCEGKSGDSRSDIYSVGCLLYEMVAGKPPFVGDTAFDTFRRHLDEQMPPLPNCEYEGLSDIIEICLAKDPSARYQTAASLKHDLLRCDKERFEKPKKHVRARRGKYVMYVLLAILLPLSVYLCYDAFQRAKPKEALYSPAKNDRQRVGSVLDNSYRGLDHPDGALSAVQRRLKSKFDASIDPNTEADYDRRIALCMNTLDYANALQSDPYVRQVVMSSRVQLAALYTLKEDFPRAHLQFDLLLNAFQKLPIKERPPRLFRDIAHSMLALANIEKARKLLPQSLADVMRAQRLAVKSDDVNEQINAAVLRVNLEMALGHLQATDHDAAGAASLLRSHSDIVNRAGWACALSDLLIANARNYAAKSEPANAKQTYQQAQSIAEECLTWGDAQNKRDEILVRSCEAQLGVIDLCHSAHELKEAKRLTDQVFNEINRTAKGHKTLCHLLGSAYFQQAVTDELEENFAVAYGNFMRAGALHLQYNDYVPASWDYTGAADVRVVEGNPEAALSLYRRAEKCLQQAKVSPSVYRLTSWKMANCLRALRRPNEAIVILQNLVPIFEAEKEQKWMDQCKQDLESTKLEIAAAKGAVPPGTAALPALASPTHK